MVLRSMICISSFRLSIMTLAGEGQDSGTACLDLSIWQLETTWLQR